MATPRKTANGNWRIQIEVGGHRDGITLPSKREAVAWAARRSAELQSEKQGGPGVNKTLSDALKRYGEEVSSTKKGWSKELIRLSAFERQPLFPAKKYIQDVTTAHIGEWRDARLKVNARGSVLRDMTLLGHVFSVARRDWQWITKNPMTDVRRPANPDHRERLITGPEIRKMLRSLGWSRKPVRSVSHAVGFCFLLALQTGMRAGELCGLSWEDVFADYCRIQDGKTGRRDVPLTPTSRRTIELMRGFDDVLVFGLKSQSLDALFRKNRARAGLDGFVFHDSRHTAATRLAQRLHVLDLCKVFGWTDTTRALTYFNPTASDIAKRITGSAPTR